MTTVRPLRLFVTVALAATLVVPAAAEAAGGPGAHQRNQRYQRHYRFGAPERARRHHAQPQERGWGVDGVLVAMGATTAPTTLSVQTSSGALVTVTVATTTTVVRRYDGLSSLDELTPGDHVSAGGSFEQGSTSTFDTTRVKDWSIQRADTRVSGRVTSVGTNVLTLRVDQGQGPRDPYRHGELVQVSLSASTLVMSGPITATLAAVQPGSRVLVLGMYDRVSRTLRADRIRVQAARSRRQQYPLLTPVAISTDVPGTATPAPSTTPAQATATATP